MNLDTVDHRRRRLVTGGLAAVSLLSWPGVHQGEASVAVDPESVAREAIVRDFLTCWSHGMRTVLSYLDPECECRLTQWGPSRTGHEEIAGGLSSNVGRPLDIVTKIFNMSSAGPVVCAHYEHGYVYETGTLVWEGMGVFVLRGHKIREWRGYTVQVQSHR